MDGALSSDRHDNNRRHDHHSHGGGGRGRGRGGRNFNNRRHHPYRRDDYGGGRHNRHHNERRYDRDNRGGHRGGRGGSGGQRRDRQPANRFSTETKSVDPQYAMMKQLTAMVAKMGDLGGAADVAGAGNEGTSREVRPVVEAIGRNVQDLVAVLCSPSNAGLFLRFGDNDTDKTEQFENGDSMEGFNGNEASKIVDAGVMAGPLVALLISCATNLPLQTPSYAALTLGVECSAPSSHAGFALRCVEFGMRCLGRDLDLMLDCKLVGVEDDNSKERDERERCQADKTGGYGNGMQIDAYYRAKLMLRFLTHLANADIICVDQQQNSNDGNNLSLLGLLQLLVQCACNTAMAATAAASSSVRAPLCRASVALASLVLSTVPYLNVDDVTNVVVDLIDELETHVLGQSYSSDFEPSVGWQAILLKGELDDGEAMAEEDEEEEEGNDSPVPSCADTLQDLLRTVRKLVNSGNHNESRFALLNDSPWKCLKMVSLGEGMEVEENGSIKQEIMKYSDEPLSLDLLGSEEEKRCRCVPYILSLDGRNKTDTELNCRLIDGIVLGRLAIFDVPPDPDDDEEEEDSSKDPNLESYINSYSIIDRFFMADAIRDVLWCHRPMVSDSGADRGNAKEVAEQIWMISHLFRPQVAPQECEDAMSSCGNDDPSKGIEYGIVETLLSLIVQSTARECDIPASSALTQHMYLTRVLLELTKLKPALVPRAIVNAISVMFEDFIPSLTPVARNNLATWLAIHLFNTDYQWPKSFWEHWGKYVTTSAPRNSRGDFVTAVLTSIAALTSDGAVTVVKDCLPSNNSLIQSVFLDGHEEISPSSAENDIIDRFWNVNHDPESVRQFVISDELTPSSNTNEETEVNIMFRRSVWWRTRMVTRALLHPATRQKSREKRIITAILQNGGDHMSTIDEVDPAEDLLTDLSDAISRFKPVILAALAKDADAYDSITTGRIDDDMLLLAGEVAILNEFENILPSWDTISYNVLIQCLLKTKIVSALAVVAWVIGDKSNATPRVISSHWWKFVSMAIQYAITSIEGSSTDLGGGIGMIMDNTASEVDAAESATKRLDDVLKVVAPILNSVVQNGSQLLAVVDGDKKIPPDGADISEGMKRLFSATLFLLYHSFSSDPPIGMRKLAFANVLKGLADVDLGWDKLASTFHAFKTSSKSNQGAKLLQDLSASFEKMM